MSEKKENKTSFNFLKNWTFLKKIKQVKHIGLIVAITFILILLAILFGDFNFFGSKSSNTSNDNSSYTNSLEYSSQMENKLKTLITKIKGSGNVEVMVTVEEDGTVIIDKTSKTNSNAIAVSGGSIVLQDGQSSPVLIEGITPKIKGVVVVSSGASDTTVRLNILRAVQTLLDLSESQIQILIGN